MKFGCIVLLLIHESLRHSTGDGRAIAGCQLLLWLKVFRACPYPYNPWCVVYLCIFAIYPTIGPFYGQMLLNIPDVEPMWYDHDILQNKFAWSTTSFKQSCFLAEKNTIVTSDINKYDSCIGYSNRSVSSFLSTVTFSLALFIQKSSLEYSFISHTIHAWNICPTQTSTANLSNQFTLLNAFVNPRVLKFIFEFLVKMVTRRHSIFWHVMTFYNFVVSWYYKLCKPQMCSHCERAWHRSHRSAAWHRRNFIRIKVGVLTYLTTIWRRWKWWTQNLGLSHFKTGPFIERESDRLLSCFVSWKIDESGHNDQI